MLPSISNSPEWLISPDCHQKWGFSRARGRVSPPPAHAYAWASFHYEFWEGQSVSEVFAGVVTGKRPLAQENFVFGGQKIRNFITHFCQKLLNTHTKLSKKRMVRHKTPLLKIKEQKKWWPPFQLIKKVMLLPFQLIKKVMTHPIFYCPPPPGRIHVWSESAPPPPFWQINHVHSAYFRLFWGYFRVISAIRPPLLDLGPLFLHILDPPLPPPVEIMNGP